MNKRPLPVTIISFVFIAAGVMGVAYHLTEFKVQHPFHDEAAWLLVVRLLAVMAGVYMPKGRYWARCLAIVWIGSHVILSSFHSVQDLAMNAWLFVVFTYFLFLIPAT